MQRFRALASYIIKQSEGVTLRLGISASRSLHLTALACIGNTLLGFGKLILGLYTLSPFVCASALYSLGMVWAKSRALIGIIQEEDAQKQLCYYKQAGLILMAASLLYSFYSARLLLGDTGTAFHLYIAISIATFTFAELALNIRGIILYRHDHTPLMHAIKTINLASSFILLALTQAALLSCTDGGAEYLTLANGVMGILMGGVAVTLGAGMILRVNRTSKFQETEC